MFIVSVLILFTLILFGLSMVIWLRKVESQLKIVNDNLFYFRKSVEEDLNDIKKFEKDIGKEINEIKSNTDDIDGEKRRKRRERIELEFLKLDSKNKRT